MFLKIVLLLVVITNWNVALAGPHLQASSSYSHSVEAVREIFVSPRTIKISEELIRHLENSAARKSFVDLVSRLEAYDLAKIRLEPAWIYGYLLANSHYQENASLSDLRALLKGFVAAGVRPVDFDILAVLMFHADLLYPQMPLAARERYAIEVIKIVSPRVLRRMATNDVGMAAMAYLFPPIKPSTKWNQVALNGRLPKNEKKYIRFMKWMLVRILKQPVPSLGRKYDETRFLMFASLAPALVETWAQKPDEAAIKNLLKIEFGSPVFQQTLLQAAHCGEHSFSRYLPSFYPDEMLSEAVPKNAFTRTPNLLLMAEWYSREPDQVRSILNDPDADARMLALANAPGAFLSIPESDYRSRSAFSEVITGLGDDSSRVPYATNAAFAGMLARYMDYFSWAGSDGAQIHVAVHPLVKYGKSNPKYLNILSLSYPNRHDLSAYQRYLESNQLYVGHLLTMMAASSDYLAKHQFTELSVRQDVITAALPIVAVTLEFTEVADSVMTMLPVIGTAAKGGTMVARFTAGAVRKALRRGMSQQGVSLSRNAATNGSRSFGGEEVEAMVDRLKGGVERLNDMVERSNQILLAIAGTTLSTQETGKTHSSGGSFMANECRSKG